MKRLLLTSFLLSLIPSANAANTCNFVSEYYPDVTIEIINGEYNSVGRGTINYKDKPVLKVKYLKTFKKPKLSTKFNRNWYSI